MLNAHELLSPENDRKSLAFKLPFLDFKSEYLPCNEEASVLYEHTKF